MVRARTNFDGKAVGYTAAVAKLASGVIHLVALARIPGLMPNMSDDHLWSRAVRPALHHAALATLDCLAQGRRWPASAASSSPRAMVRRSACWGPDPRHWMKSSPRGVRDRRLAMAG